MEFRSILKYECYSPNFGGGTSSNREAITVEHDKWDMTVGDFEVMFEQLICAIMQRGYVVEITARDDISEEIVEEVVVEDVPADCTGCSSLIDAITAADSNSWIF